MVDTQIETHALYGGVVPEDCLASPHGGGRARDRKALADAKMDKHEVDAVAATRAGTDRRAAGRRELRQIAGICDAKALYPGASHPRAYRGDLGIRRIPTPKPPFLTLIASGGHSEIVMVRDYTDFEILGGTRDDAAGEAFDKVARVLGVGKPGGPKIDKLAQEGDPKRYKLPDSHIKDAPLDFSFSGLKTAVIKYSAHNAEQKAKDGKKRPGALFVRRSCTRWCRGSRRRSKRTHGRAGSRWRCGGQLVLRAALQEMAKRTQHQALPAAAAPVGITCRMIGSQAYYEYLAGNTGTTLQNAFATAEISENICEKR